MTLFVRRPFVAKLFAFIGQFMLLAAAVVAQAQQLHSARDGAGCGEVVALDTRAEASVRYAFVPPSGRPEGRVAVTLLLLAGGSGHVDLDEQGCPRELKGNSLVRSISLFNAAGFGTALLDAPSDHHGPDGLGGFRITAAHAEDLGRAIVDLRRRTQGEVWVVGTSRGSISAANAAARLSGAAAPDGLVLTSVVTSGQRAARKSWVAQTVFDLPLGNIRVPVLVIGHVADKCVRSPPSAMAGIVSGTSSARQQVVTVVGGPGDDGPPGLNACEGRTPHGFVDQEAEVAAGIARFVHGGRY